jgi:hypothetical protein
MVTIWAFTLVTAIIKNNARRPVIEMELERYLFIECCFVILPENKYLPLIDERDKAQWLVCTDARDKEPWLVCTGCTVMDPRIGCCIL